ncbi:hypothetical protein FRC07_001367, partial [Ceratobasidium sp. 392]
PHPGSKSAREALRKESHSRIEKRRREKINDTLTALRELIAQGEGGPVRQEQSPPPSPEKEFKLELLERTVTFVKGLLERTRALEKELAELKGESTGEPPAKRKKMTPMSSPNAGPSTSTADVDELALDRDDESSLLSELEPEPEAETVAFPRRTMSIAALLSPAMAPTLPSPPPSGQLNQASAGPSTETHMEALNLPSPEVALRRSSTSTSPERHPSSLKRPREVEGDDDTAAAALLLQFSSKTPMSTRSGLLLVSVADGACRSRTDLRTPLEDHHSLLPNRGQSGDTFVSPVPANRFSVWTFGRGTVIWRIWPAVLLHTCVAAIVVLVSHRTRYNLAIPNVLVTVAGVVIGFVISYRAMSGYDRYWQGRTMWSDLIKNGRTIGRLIWLHVPNTVSKSGTTLSEKEKEREAEQVVNEKRTALGLVEGYAIAVKHHLRGETGIYYEDLYYLVSSVPHISKHFSTTSPTAATFAGPSTSNGHSDYGTFHQPPPLDTNPNGLTTFPFPTPPSPTPSQPLLPGNRPPPAVPTPSRSLIPFTSLVVPFTALLGMFSWVATKTTGENPQLDPERAAGTPAEPGPRPWQEPWRNVQRKFTVGHKYYPLVAGESQLHLPLAILRRLSEWVAVLDARGSTGGAAIGGMMGCLASFEDQLSGLERILTTPLPFVFSVHIRHTVWLYLFFLPFQLTEGFGYWTIFGVGVAAFMFLGLLAAGEEIEQPFGYDENDLDLDLFISEILHRDLQALMDMWPYHTRAQEVDSQEQGLQSSGASIRKVVDAPVDVGDEIGVNEEGRPDGSARLAGRVDEI